MRTTILAITAAVTMSLGAAALSAGFTTPALAATAKSIKAKMAEMKAKDPQNYDKCLGLARERGFRPDTETSSGLMMFVDGCIMGKQR